MDHKKISLESLTKNFEFEKMCRDIDNISDINFLKDLTKSYIKLYLKQQEVLSNL